MTNFGIGFIISAERRKMTQRIDENHWLLKTPVAHRGLHDIENGIPENSFKAYEAAIENGYPIEMDIQLTSDNALVCFHDDNLKRMTGADSLIWDKTLEEVESLSLAGTTEKIPLFDDFLKFVNGRTPVVIELKSQRTKGVIVDEVIKRLDGYKGDFVVQSFDPFIMREFRKKRPDFIRGQLIDKGRHKQLSFFADKLLGMAFFNFTVRPDFMNMNVEYIPVSKRMSKNRRVITWTIRNDEDRKKAEKFADNYIFEIIRP